VLWIVGRVVFAVLSGVAAAFIAAGFGMHGNGPFLIGCAVAFVVMVLLG
jgi:hypothetical protein